MMEEPIKIQTYDNPPSPQQFSSQIEPKNVPAVFTHCVNDWIAFSKWNPSNGGLDYLQDRVGLCTVEAMFSRSAPVFYGDLKSHERVPVPFSLFVGFCKKKLEGKDGGHSVGLESESQGVAASDIDKDGSLCVDCPPEQIYLAQVPIMNMENEARVQLETLIEDIQTPALLGTKEISSINLWMNSARARSSTHYDHHNNLLCIVAGCKEVALFPPSASPLLYPMPLYGEASNHSSVALENPDFSVHPRAERLMDHSQKIILHAGDALFIPEGWFHQVDSDELTIAVNFWWRSNTMSSMTEHMDSYYLRRILRRLIDKEMSQVLPKRSTDMRNMQKQICELQLVKNEEADYQSNGLDHNYNTQNLEKKRMMQQTALNELPPLELQALHEIVTLVHDGVNVTEDSHLDQSTSTSEATCSMKGELKKKVPANLFRLEDDPVAKIIWTVDSHSLQNIFLVMVNNFPRTLETLIIHLLSPVGAEVLTRKFDEIDQITHEEERNKFYQAFYGVFDDHFLAMDVILNGKELFARQAFKNVMDQYMGVNLDGPAPVVR